MRVVGQRGEGQARSPPAPRVRDLGRSPGIRIRASKARNRNWADGSHRQPRSTSNSAHAKMKGSHGMTKRTSDQGRYKRLTPPSQPCRLCLQRNQAIAGEPAAIPVRAECGVTG
jgi:hypothetical protein